MAWVPKLLLTWETATIYGPGICSVLMATILLDLHKNLFEVCTIRIPLLQRRMLGFREAQTRHLINGKQHWIQFPSLAPKPGLLTWIFHNLRKIKQYFSLEHVWKQTSFKMRGSASPVLTDLQHCFTMFPDMLRNIRVQAFWTNYLNAQ